MWDSLEPLKDASADRVLLDAGIVSRQQLIEERGRDVEDVDDEIQRDSFVPRINASSGNPALAGNGG